MSYDSVVNHVCCVIKDSFPFTASKFTVPCYITVQSGLSHHRFCVFLPDSFFKRP